VRHAASDGVASAGGDADPAGIVVPAATGPGALVLLDGVPRPDEHPPPAVPEVVSALRAAGWDHVVVIGGDARSTAVAHALGRGARAFLVAARGSSTSNTSAEAATGSSSCKAVPVVDVGGRESTLSAREVQVLALAADGLSNPEIARELGLSALTVKSHLGRMTRRLGARDRAHLVLLALRAGVIA
jgi:DNA-binding NarL/FixJ family response regulator